MSGDLIRRSVLLEDIRNNITEMSGTMDWLKLIDRQPTAYNVDKVVEQFERKKSNEEDYCVEDREIAKFCNGVIDGFIEIVKAGGISERD